MAGWLRFLRVNPLPPLLDSQDRALGYFVRRDLVQESVPPIDALWQLPEPTRRVQKQEANGAWKYPGKPKSAGQNYALLETFRSLRILVKKYGFNVSHPALARAAEYVFTCQTPAGDIRGIIGSQYMPYYHGAILELLIESGYANDRRVQRGLDWLLEMRQEDGGWIVPAQAVPSNLRSPRFWLGPTLSPDRSLPHSHLATGMVLRAFVAHPRYCRQSEVVAAGAALKGRLFQPDRYNDRKAAFYWLKFQFPFWWSNLLTALDSLSQLGFSRRDGDIARALEWFAIHQEADGLWPTGYDRGEQAALHRKWVGLAICRVLKRLL